MKRLFRWFKWHFYYKHECEKCMVDPHYFFTKYLTINGKSATTLYTKEEFNKYYFRSIGR